MSLTAERLRELLDYEPLTGVFTRRVDAHYNAKAGQVAGWVGGHGYLSVNLEGSPYTCHQLAWLYVHGAWPAQHIDHINGVKTDNRIANLRDVSRSVNLQNLRSANRDNKTGLLGVSPYFRDPSRFIAQIGVGGKRFSLGLFDTPEQAHEAYLAAKRELHEGCTL